MSGQAKHIEQSASQVLTVKPTTLDACHAVIYAQALQISQLLEHMAAIQERLKLDSRNSSKPPSSDDSDRKPIHPSRAHRQAVHPPQPLARKPHRLATLPHPSACQPLPRARQPICFAPKPPSFARTTFHGKRRVRSLARKASAPCARTSLGHA
jgi:hypothetical protein